GLAPESGVVHLAGLTAPVTVIRDTAGVPHIYAQNRLDLARALGYTQAQDRLFQLEMRRRLAEGRLAEVFGADLVESDYVYRLFDPEKFARDSVATYPPDARASGRVHRRNQRLYRRPSAQSGARVLAARHQAGALHGRRSRSRRADDCDAAR